MKLAYEPRASTILYNLLKSRSDSRPFLLPASLDPIVALTFLKAEIPFEFVDISPVTLHMDLEAAFERLQSGQFGGLLYFHSFGETSTPSGFFAQAKALDPSLLLIDDRRICPPDAQPDPEMASDVAIYSTGPGRVVEIGFGGFAFAQDEVLYNRQHLPFQAEALETLEKAIWAALKDRQEFVYNDHDWLETDRGLPEWKDYFRAIAGIHGNGMGQRRTINAVYTSRLPVEIQLPAPYQLWRFNIMVRNKAQILRALAEAGIPAEALYPSLAGCLAPGKCPEAEKLSSQVINLLNGQQSTVAMAEKACDIILKHL